MKLELEGLRRIVNWGAMFLFIGTTSYLFVKVNFYSNWLGNSMQLGQPGFIFGLLFLCTAIMSWKSDAKR